MQVAVTVNSIGKIGFFFLSVYFLVCDTCLYMPFANDRVRTVTVGSRIPGKQGKFHWVTTKQ